MTSAAAANTNTADTNTNTNSKLQQKSVATDTVYQSKRTVRIYTRTGDKGKSSLFNGERKPKHDPIFEALGDSDELNASLGIAKQYIGMDAALASSTELAAQLTQIQSRLMDIGSAMATPLNSSKSNEQKLGLTQFNAQNEHTLQLEQWIDAMNDALPPLTNFILPSGGLPAVHLHMSRAICRRCERHSTLLLNDGSIDQNVITYINRLSDYLFVAARFAAMKNNQIEYVYQKQREANNNNNNNNNNSGNSNQTDHNANK